MAFSAFGSLGSEGAAGFLGGMQTASQRIEKQKSDKDTEAMRMYSKLLESGEWEPVGPEGSADGGVLRIGSVGMLRRRKTSPDIKSFMQIKNLQSLIKTREKEKTPMEGAVRTLPVQITGPKGGKIPGKQVQEYINGKWTDKGGKVVSSQPPSVGIQTWVKGNERVNLPKTEGAPTGPGWVKYSDFSRDRSFTQREDAEQARIVGTKLKLVEDIKKKKLRSMQFIGDETFEQSQAQYKQAYIEAEGLRAEQKALAKGVSPELRTRLVEEAQARARRELIEKYPEPEPDSDEGFLDWLLERINPVSKGTKEEQNFTQAPPVSGRSELLQRGQPPFRRLP